MAEILVLEDFDDSATGWDGSYWGSYTIPGTLWDGQLEPGYGQFMQANAEAGEKTRYINPSISTSVDGVYYFAGLYKCTNTGKYGGFKVGYGSNAADFEFLWQGGMYWGALKPNGAWMDPRNKDPYAVNATYLGVLKLVIDTVNGNTLSATMFDMTNGDVLDPAVEPTWTDTEDTTLPSQINRIIILGYDSIGASFDNIMITTTWADVALQCAYPSKTVTVAENGGTDTVDLSLTAIPGLVIPASDFPVSLTISGGDPNVTVSPANPVFASIDDVQTITITGVDNSIVDGDSTVQLDVSLNATDPNFVCLTKAIEVSIIDDDTPQIALVDADMVEVGENGGSDTFAVGMEAGNAPLSTITITLTPDVDYLTVTPSVITLTPASYADVTVTVTAIDNDLANAATVPYESYVRNITTAVAASGPEEMKQVGTIAVTILEDDCGALGYSIADISRDCYVNMEDFSLMAAQWLSETMPND